LPEYLKRERLSLVLRWYKNSKELSQFQLLYIIFFNGKNLRRKRKLSNNKQIGECLEPQDIEKIQYIAWDFQRQKIDK